MKTLLITLCLTIGISAPAWAFDEMHLKKFRALNKCENCDLSEVNLKGADLVSGLKGASLTGASLSGVNLDRANLSEADLSEADLSEATLKDAKLDGAILCKTKMPWGEENSGCKKGEKTSKQPAKQKSAANYKKCKKGCAELYMACAMGTNIKPETCAENSNQC